MVSQIKIAEPIPMLYDETPAKARRLQFRRKMKDWGKELYTEGMEGKGNIIPDILNLVRERTGYEGEFNIKYNPSWFIFSGPMAITVFNTNTGEIKRHEIRMREPRLYSNSPWSVYFYLWSLTGEALHIADRFLYGMNKSSNESEIHTKALILTDEYIEKIYPKWYRKNRRILGAIKNEIISINNNRMKNTPTYEIEVMVYGDRVSLLTKPISLLKISEID